MKARYALGLVAALACALAVAACGGSSSNNSGGSGGSHGSSKSPVNLALISFNTPGSSLLPEFQTAANAAANYINSNGGFGGRKLVIDTCNSMLEPAAATVCAHKTLTDNPVAMVGCELTWYASGLPIYKAAGIPSLNCLNGEQDVTNPYSFGLNTSATGEDVGLMKYLCTQSDVHKVMSLVPEDPQFSSAIYPALKKTLNGCGKVSDVLYYPLTAVDVAPYVAKAVGVHPDFIFLSSIGALVDSFYKAFQQNGFPASKTAVPDTDFTPSVTKPAGSLLNGALVQGQFVTANNTATDPSLAAFVKSLNGNAADTDDPNVAWAWSLVMFVYDAAKTIGFDKFNAHTFYTFLHTPTKSYPLPLSHPIAIPGPSSAPQIRQPYVRIERWDNGKFTPLKVGPTGDGWFNGWTP